MDVKKTKVESLDIIVTMMEDKPYYEIKYKEVGSDHFCIGYSSYRLDYVLEWKKQYFELVEKEKEPVKRVWSKWKLGYIIFYNPNRECIEKEIYYRENRKRVQVKLKDGSLRANASCCKEDEFDLSKGRELAERRLIMKYLAREVKKYADSL